MEAVEKLAPEIGTKPACEAIGLSRAGLYRQRSIDKAAPVVRKKRPAPPRTLNIEEEQRVLDILHSERFQDKAPHEVYATLLDEGRYLLSIRTMYRIL
jgi:putative transposase